MKSKRRRNAFVERIAALGMGALAVLALESRAQSQISDSPEQILIREDNNDTRAPPPDSGTNHVAASPLVVSVAPGAPNIVFIISDDQAPSHYSFTGNGAIQTPRLDSLAASGALFKNFYVVNGQCAPSRATLWTGKMPHTHMVEKNGVMLSEWIPTLPQILKEAGYLTHFIGKCHLGDPNAPQDLLQRGFDRYLTFLPDIGRLPEETNWRNYQMIRQGETASGHAVDGKYVTDHLTDEAIKAIWDSVNPINNPTRKPFFLWLAHIAPHEPRIEPPDCKGYQAENMPLPSSISDTLDRKPRPQRESASHKRFLELGCNDGTRKRAVQEELRKAYEVVSNLDTNIGRVLNTLDKAGVRQNTLIVFLSDNGLYYGEHQLVAKGPFFYEEQVRMPLILSYPTKISARVSTALTSSIDILPTILELAGVSVNATSLGAQGKSFASLATSGQLGTYNRNSVMMEYGGQDILMYPMRGIVNSDGFKWVHYLSTSFTWNGDIRYDGKDHELYNLQTDPLEMNNLMARKKLADGTTDDPADNPLLRLAVDPQLGSIVRKLRRQLATKQTNFADPIARGFTVSAVTILVNVVNGSAQTGTLTWTSPSPASSEVVFRPAFCSGCIDTEVYDLNLVTSHVVPLNNLTRGTTYTAEIYNIGGSGNGGVSAASFTIP